MKKTLKHFFDCKKETIDLFSESYCIKGIISVISIMFHKEENFSLKNKHNPIINDTNKANNEETNKFPSHSFDPNEFIISEENIDTLIKKHHAITTVWITSKLLLFIRFLLLLLFFLIFLYSIIILDFMLILICFTYFTLDFLFYRYISQLKYKRDLLILKEIIKRGFYNIYYSKENYEDTYVKKQYTLSSRNCFLKPGYDYTTYKEKILSNEFSNLCLRNKLILDVGGAEGQSSYILNKENKLIISDLNISCLSDGKKRGIIAIQSISERLPFKEDSFDVIVFTEVIEHLQNPFIVLKEIKRVLKKKGILILTTGNNRSFFSAFCINPFILFEKVTSQYYDAILPPRRLISTDQHTYYHVNYSKKELNSIILLSGFSPITYYTFGALLFLGRIFPLKWIVKSDNIFMKFPSLKFTGSGFFMIAKKEK